MSAFVKGAKVTWRSQSAGTWKEKTGQVVAVVPADGYPTEALKAVGINGRAGDGRPRDHESYVVRARGRLYWPRVSALVLVAVDAPEAST
jgi:hypothetical protein